MMKTLKLKAVFLGFLTVIMASINFTSCNKQVQILEIEENPTLEQNTISKEFIAHLVFFETADFVPHYYVGKAIGPDQLGISPVAYRLDKQHPEAADFIQLIKDAQEANKPLKVTVETDDSKTGQYITKIE